MSDTINFKDFAKVDIRVGKIVEASIPEGSEKLIRQVVDFGEEVGRRIIFSGIKAFYNPEDLVGRQACYVINLEPRPMMGEESQGMLVAAAPEDDDGNMGCAILSPDKPVVNGTKVI